ncbi:kinase-like domain-containing protein, partial [Glomus cerebriforme]
IMVMEFASLGSLDKYLNNEMKWSDRTTALLNISIGLNNMHQSGLVHRDFHPGNLVFNHNKNLLITDLGLCKPANQSSQSCNFGVVPYVAPEVLKGQPYTKAADIYSFGMVMYFIATGKQPFADYAHDHYLVITICNGNRPEIDESIAPKCYIDLMKRCWDSNPKNRPSTIEITNLIK